LLRIKGDIIFNNEACVIICRGLTKLFPLLCNLFS